MIVFNARLMTLDLVGGGVLQMIFELRMNRLKPCFQRIDLTGACPVS